jgi:hypothetical protein
MGSTTPQVAAQWVASFVQRLRELGWLADIAEGPRLTHLGIYGRYSAVLQTPPAVLG